MSRNNLNTLGEFLPATEKTLGRAAATPSEGVSREKCTVLLPKKAISVETSDAADTQ
jgi:hypothetical protein